MKWSVYGAGTYCSWFLPIIKEQFTVEYIFDMSEEKQGSYVFGVPVCAPEKKLINKNPIIVLLNDLESGYDSLISLGCKQVIYALAQYQGGYSLYEYKKPLQLYSLAKSAIRLETKWDNTINQLIETTSQKYNSNHIRFFNLAAPVDFDATGGPCACLRNLYLANEQYGLIENFFTICPSTLKIPYDYNLKIDNKQKNNIFNGMAVDAIVCNDVISGNAIATCLFILSTCDFLKKMEVLFDLNENDVFLLQDPYMIQAFIYTFPNFKRVIAVNHVQGAMSSELGKQNPELVDSYNQMQEEQLRCIKNWIFPSVGAKEGFLRTASEGMLLAAKDRDFHIAYNGYEQKDTIHPDKDFVIEMDKINKEDVLFVSATFLYKNKGVERIPKILKDFKNITGCSVKWILVGNGEMHDEVEANINKYLVPSDYVWYKQRFDNQDNIFELFRRADFYIMMHRVSVFDLSILQAMSYECVPLLTNLGGNVELCSYNNGILVNENKMTLDLELLLENGKWSADRLEVMKKQNKEVVEKKFNNKEFLKGYREVLYNIGGVDG
ncbi:MAG: glycosyltransferase [Pseudobutyrivibrio sp.]|nr:glycosyltransferase [Pseudobutyrivibrio sp.]